MKIWKAHFSDEKHDTHIDIINTEGTFSDDSLSFTINGTDFFGSGFDDFHLTSPEKYDFDTNEFQLLKWETKNKGYEYSLQRFSMEITIPFPVINIKTNKTENSFLRIKYACEQSKENERSVQCILNRPLSSRQIKKQKYFYRIPSCEKQGGIFYAAKA